MDEQLWRLQQENQILREMLSDAYQHIARQEQFIQEQNGTIFMQAFLNGSNLPEFPKDVN